MIRNRARAVAALLFAVPAPLPALEVYHAESVRRGEALAVEIVGEALHSATVTVTLPNGRQHAATAWRFQAPRAPWQAFGSGVGGMGVSRWVALVGVPSTSAVGEASIEVGVTRTDGRVELGTRGLLVTEREFHRQEIPLSGAMTELRTSRDPRIAEQSAELWRLIHVFDERSRHHTGPFTLPVSGARRTSPFGERRVFLYSDGGTARSVHNGLDFAAPTGTPIYAPGGGRVVMSKNRILTGKTIIIEHLPGVFSIFYHLDELRVEPGTTVAGGEEIGTVGSSGLSTGPHLHWELRMSGVAVDPDEFLAQPLLDMSRGGGR